MATTIGRVDYKVGLDGKAIPAEARVIGEEAGAAMGKSFNDRFSKSFSKIGEELATDMQQNGELAGISFTDSMRAEVKQRLAGISTDLAKAFGDKDGLKTFGNSLEDVEKHITDLREKLLQLRAGGGLTDKMFYRLNGTLNNYIGSVRKASAAGESLDKFFTDDAIQQNAQKIAQALAKEQRQLESFAKTAERDRARIAKAAEGEAKRVAAAAEREARAMRGGGGIGGEEQNRSLKELYRNLSANTRQWVAIGAAIASAGSDIAVLGSFAGSTLVILATAASSAFVGISLIASAFGLVTGRIKDANPRIASIAKTVKTVGDAFKGLRESLALSVFRDLQKPFAALPKLFKGLTPALQAFSREAGAAFGSVLRNLESPKGVKDFAALLRGLGKIFTPLVGAAEHFGSAIAHILLLAVPFTQTFAKGIDAIALSFSHWTQSAKGTSAITDFFKHGQQIAKPFLDLVGTLAQGLSSLVTPLALKNLTTFLKNMTASVPFLISLLDNIGKFDLPGVLASALGEIGPALIPFLKILGTIGQYLSLLLKNIIIPFLAYIIGTIGDTLGPLQKYADEAVKSFDGLSEAIKPLFPIVRDLAAAFFDVVNAFVTALFPSIGQLEDSFKGDLKTNIKNFGETVRTVWIPALENAAPKAAALGKAVKEFAKFLIEHGADILDFGLKLATLADDVASAAKRIAAAISIITSPLKPAIDLFNTLAKAIGNAFNTSKKKPVPGASGGIGGISVRPTAVGGTFAGAQTRLIAEAGREAVVPLDRDPRTVDPSVRDLAAYAQGKGGRGAYVAPGAIVIQTVGNASIVATKTLDALVGALR